MAETSNQKRGSTVEIVREIVQPLAGAMGLDLWDVRYEKEGAAWYLRIYIDKPGGVTIEDCENLSRAVDAPIDEADPIPGSYYLEVWSPGMERELSRPEHFPPYIGREVRVRLIRPLDGERELIGKLTGFEDGKVSLETNGKTVCIEKKQAAFIKLYVDFEAGGVPKA